MSSSTIGKVLSDATFLAGLGDKGYSAKSFRPTAATKAICMGCDPNVACAIGSWKSQEVFQRHYVHTKVPQNYVDNLLQ